MSNGKVSDIFKYKPRGDFEMQYVKAPILDMEISDLINYIGDARDTVSPTTITAYYRFKTFAEIQHVSHLGYALNHFFQGQRREVGNFIGKLMWSIYQSIVTTWSANEELRYFGISIVTNPFGISVEVSRMREGWSIKSRGKVTKDDYESFASALFVMDPC